MPGTVFPAYSLSTVVQVTAEAGVGFYFWCARCTTLWVTDCLCEFRRNTKYIQTKSPNNSCWHLAYSTCNFALIPRSAPGKSFFPYLAAQLLQRRQSRIKMHGTRADQPLPSTMGKSKISSTCVGSGLCNYCKQIRHCWRKASPDGKLGQGIVKRLTLTDGKIPILENNWEKRLTDCLWAVTAKLTWMVFWPKRERTPPMPWHNILFAPQAF